MHAVRGRPPEDGGHGAARLRPGAALRQGLLNDLGNPKIAVFFTTLLPQFAPAHGPAFPTLLAFGLLFCAMTFAWLCAYSVAVAHAGRALRRPRIRRALDAVMGAALVAVGVRVAVERQVGSARRPTRGAHDVRTRGQMGRRDRGRRSAPRRRASPPTRPRDRPRACRRRG